MVDIFVADHVYTSLYTQTQINGHIRRTLKFTCKWHHRDVYCSLLYNLLLLFPLFLKKLSTMLLRPIFQPSGQCSLTYVVFRQCHITRHLCRVPPASTSLTIRQANIGLQGCGHKYPLLLHPASSAGTQQDGGAPLAFPLRLHLFPSRHLRSHSCIKSYNYKTTAHFN